MRAEETGPHPRVQMTAMLRPPRTSGATPTCLRRLSLFLIPCRYPIPRWRREHIQRQFSLISRRGFENFRRALCARYLLPTLAPPTEYSFLRHWRVVTFTVYSFYKAVFGMAHLCLAENVCTGNVWSTICTFGLVDHWY